MLNEKEKAFVDYWATNREKEARLARQLATGLPIGLLFALPVVLLLFTGRYWYKRADMAAHSQLSMWVLAIAVLAIAVFVGVFYKRHQWEMREQQYLELRAKQGQNS